MRNIKFFGIFLTLCLAVACKDKPTEDETVFEKKDILVNLADHWIGPRYEAFQQKMNTLNNAWNDFKLNPDQSKFVLVQDSWKDCYLAFQGVKIIDFGPAMSNGFVNALGTFPCDTNQIENNITAGTYTLGTVSNASAIGFAALDYLLFSPNAFSSLSSASNRQVYVTDLIAKMKQETDAVVAGWPSYRATFVDGTGTSSTSPFSQLVNAFCKDYEICKNAKLGIPIGKQSLGIQRPEYLEAPKSGLNKALMQENFIALQSLFLGQGVDGTNGSGFDDYLEAIEKQSLRQTIETRFAYLTSTPTGWNENLAQLMLSNPSVLDDYYTYTQNTLVYLKTDMASAFGILITYQDNDGD